jgi:thiamine biosynthesis lipoprotein
MLEIYKFECFTSPCEVQLFCNDRQKANNCAKEILEETKRLELKYNYFNSNSLISKINNRTINILDNETKNILTKAKQYYKLTNGIFDITIATIKDLYQDNNNLKDIASKKIKLLPYIGCEHYNIKKNKIYFDNIYTKIDLGGFVKEYSVDKAILIIKKYHIKSALVNFGGDIYALGKKPDNSKFNIGITNPIDKEKILFSIPIENQSLTTSASYERYKVIENQNISHIMSKSTNEHNILSATVVSNSCITSGIFSTSLMINPKLTTKEQIYLINNKLEIIP